MEEEGAFSWRTGWRRVGGGQKATSALVSSAQSHFELTLAHACSVTASWVGVCQSAHTLTQSTDFGLEEAHWRGVDWAAWQGTAGRPLGPEGGPRDSRPESGDLGPSLERGRMPPTAGGFAGSPHAVGEGWGTR